MSEQCSVMMDSITGMMSLVAAVLSSPVGIVMGAPKRATHLPGFTVLSETGMIGQSYFCASIVGRGVMEVSFPKSGSWMPAFPECWSARIPRTPPSRRNLLASMSPRLRPKRRLPSRSRLIVMWSLIRGLLSGRNIHPTGLSLSNKGAVRPRSSQFPI